MHSGSVLRPKDLSYKSAIANDLKKKYYANNREWKIITSYI